MASTVSLRRLSLPFGRPTSRGGLESCNKIVQRLHQWILKKQNKNFSNTSRYHGVL